jgi:hypothetical protein
MVVFCTFGSSNVFQTGLTRIGREATSLNVFRKILCWNETQLEREFVAKHQEWFAKDHQAGRTHSSNGYGFFVWKPQVILQALNECEPDEILVYSDCGCTLNVEGRTRLLHYIDDATRTDLVSFQLPHLERAWTKGHVLEKFPEAFGSTGQYLSGIFLVKNTEPIRDLVLRWKTMMEDYTNIDNSESQVPNHPEFQEHRHDQSCFSLLRKEYEATHSHTVYPDLTYFDDWKSHKDEPFHATRLRK